MTSWMTGRTAQCLPIDISHRLFMMLNETGLATSSHSTISGEVMLPETWVFDIDGHWQCLLLVSGPASCHHMASLSRQPRLASQRDL